MIDSLYQELGQDYYLPIPLWNMVPASQFWSPVNFFKMGMQGGKRFFQTMKNGKPSVFLDASGYQLGDPWEKMSTALSMRLTFYQYYKKKGVKLIMLPQSMGPFTNPLVASNAAGILQLADLIFVRCEESRKHALSVGCPEKKIMLAPDYSNLVSPEPADLEKWHDVVCLVPSMRMMDKTPGDLKDKYFESMIRFTQLIKAKGLKPCLLVHQQEDLTLARQINDALDTPVMLVDPEPQEAKSIIASSRAIIGSRYHSIVSALSQATPIIGTGWTHKYQSLFNDYDSVDYLLADYTSARAIEESLDKVLDENTRPALISTLTERSEALKGRTRLMYQRLREEIES